MPEERELTLSFFFISPLVLMDITEALMRWEDKSSSHTIKSEELADGYYVYFLKEGNTVGYIKAVAGGIYWNYPDELFALPEGVY